ncbi:hypothetical protein GCM10023155_35950 [Bremerella cremea]
MRLVAIECQLFFDGSGETFPTSTVVWVTNKCGEFPKLLLSRCSIRTKRRDVQVIGCGDLL